MTTNEEAAAQTPIETCPQIPPCEKCYSETLTIATTALASANKLLAAVRELVATMRSDPGSPQWANMFTAGWSGASSYYADELAAALEGDGDSLTEEQEAELDKGYDLIGNPYPEPHEEGSR